MKKIAVVMSTYNGQKYVGEQIESIQHQDGDGKNFKLHLYVRDDKSNDDTLKVVSKFADVTVISNGGNNVGVKESFFTLLNKVTDSDLLFFSDQDDIWPKDKVKKFCEVYDNLEEKEKNKPVGIFSDLWVSDINGDSTGTKMSQVVEWAPKSDFYYLSWSHKVTGAAFAINNVARLMATTIDPKMYEKINMHDSFIALLISITGNLTQIDEPLLMYRQHNNNIIGAKKKRSILMKFRSVFKLATRLYQDNLYAYEWIIKNQSQFTINEGTLNYFKKIYMMSNSNFFTRVTTWKSMLKYMMSARLPFTTFYLYVLNIKPKNKFWEF